MTTSSLAVRPLVAADRELLDRLWLLFRHDMSEITHALPDRRGRFRDERLRSAFEDPAWCGFVAAQGDHPVAFALVRGLDAPVRVLSSFFVVRGARRGGAGRALARHVLTTLPGRWEIAFQDANGPAVAFWHAVAVELAGATWTEEHRAVPARPDLPPDTWVSLSTVPQAGEAG
jgi:predicted acetyltransferase